MFNIPNLCNLIQPLVSNRLIWHMCFLIQLWGLYWHLLCCRTNKKMWMWKYLKLSKTHQDVYQKSIQKLHWMWDKGTWCAKMLTQFLTHSYGTLSVSWYSGTLVWCLDHRTHDDLLNPEVVSYYNTNRSILCSPSSHPTSARKRRSNKHMSIKRKKLRVMQAMLQQQKRSSRAIEETCREVRRAMHQQNLLQVQCLQLQERMMNLLEKMIQPPAATSASWGQGGVKDPGKLWSVGVVWRRSCSCLTYSLVEAKIQKYIYYGFQFNIEQC